MNRKLRGSFARDEGMTIIEVVVASVILFFVLTAILGLVATTTNMGLSARQRAAATNAISSHIEFMRSLDWDEVQSVPSEVPIAVDGFAGTIETVFYEGDNGTLEVEISATVTGSGFTPMTLTRSIVLRDPDSFTVTRDAADGPTVEYVYPTPAENSIVYGNSVYPGGGDLNIAVEADCQDPDDLITEVTMVCPDMPLRDSDSTYADSAVWTSNENHFEDSFHWYTKLPEIHEGNRLVSAVVTDSNGLQATANRQFYVDNYAPGQPGVPTAQFWSSTQTRLSWTRAKEIDSDDAFPVYAPLYLIKWYQVQPSGSIPAEGSWNTGTLEENAWIQTVQPFSRYEFGVASGSLRFVEGRPFEWVAQPYFSAPRLTGTATITAVKFKNTTTVHTDVALAVSQPTFPVSGIRYDLYRALTIAGLKSSSPVALNVDPSAITNHDEVAGGSSKAYYYAVKATFTPSVYKPAQGQQELWSNAVGPVPVASPKAGTVIVEPLAEQLW